MQLLATKLLITLIAFDLCRATTVVEDQVAQETNRIGVNTDVPKYVTVKPPEFKPLPIRAQPKTFSFLSFPNILPINQIGYPKKPLYQKPPRNVKTPQHSMTHKNIHVQNVQVNSHQRPFTLQQTKLKQSQNTYTASTQRPIAQQSIQSPKFSLPVQTVNGIQVHTIKVSPPNKVIILASTTSSTTTTTTTTTPKPLRTKRIWPKHMLSKLPKYNITVNMSNYENSIESVDNTAAASEFGSRSNISTVGSTTTTTTQNAPRVYRKVTRKPKHPTTTNTSQTNTTLSNTTIEENGWVPIIPSHFTHPKKVASHPKRRSGGGIAYFADTTRQKRSAYIPTYGYLPRKQVGRFPKSSSKLGLRNKRKPKNLYVYSGFSGRIYKRPFDVTKQRQYTRDLDTAQTRERVVKIKHHHHHHHHKYIKTVEKPVKVPVKVEVPKPYYVEKKVPVQVPVEKIVHKVIEKKVPYPVTVEKKVPVPFEVKVPHPVPYKVVEKEYVPKPYPVVHHIPVIKQVEVRVPHPVPVPVEKHVPVPVNVPVPYEKRIHVPVHVEKQVPVPVPVKVLVPHPVPYETRVPYPVEVKVKEPVIQQVPVKVYVPKPYPVSVPKPYPVHIEKRVPVPVEVEKKVPVPVRIYVPHPVPVDRERLPYYMQRQYPSATPIPISEGPLESQLVTAEPLVTGSVSEAVVTAGLTVDDNYVTNTPHHQVTIHGKGHFTGFSDRSDTGPSTTTPTP